MEGASLAGCAAQKEPQTRGHGGTPGQPDSTDWRVKQSQGAGGTNRRCAEGPGGGGAVGEEKNGGVRTDEGPGQLGKAESNCRYMCLQDMTKAEVRLNPCLLLFYSNSLHSTHWYNLKSPKTAQTRKHSKNKYEIVNSGDFVTV